MGFSLSSNFMALYRHFLWYSAHSYLFPWSPSAGRILTLVSKSAVEKIIRYLSDNLSHFPGRIADFMAVLLITLSAELHISSFWQTDLGCKRDRKYKLDKNDGSGRHTHCPKIPFVCLILPWGTHPFSVLKVNLISALNLEIPTVFYFPYEKSVQNSKFKTKSEIRYFCIWTRLKILFSAWPRDFEYVNFPQYLKDVNLQKVKSKKSANSQTSTEKREFTKSSLKVW